MIISPNQYSAFVPAARERFEVEMLEHLRSYAPELAEVAGDAGLRKVVCSGIDRAAKYGFTHRGPVRFFLELMLSFGVEFDTDLQYSRFHPPLRDAETDQMARAIHLFGITKAYFEVVSGHENALAIAAMSRSLEMARHDDLARWRGASTERLLELYHVVYPEKYVYLGEDALGGLIKRGFQPSSADFQVPEDARHIVALLMYGFGSGVVQDPLYPWVRQNWVELASEGTGFAARLTNRAAIYLGRVLAVYRAAS